MTGDHVNQASIKHTRAVNALFAFTRDAYESEFGDDKSQQREFCRRVAEKYAELIGCQVVDVSKLKSDIEATYRGPRSLPTIVTNESSPEVAYAIGVEDSPGSFGMTHGPAVFLRDMLAVDPPDEKAKIIKFTIVGNRRTDPQTDVVYEVKAGAWQTVAKSRATIPTANPLATKAIALAEQIIELADSPDLPPAAIDYAESVTGKARDILESVESENRATSGQIKALQNMLAGLGRWFNRRGYDAGRGIGDDPMDDYMQFGDFC